jgi:hypothetical protein
MRIMRLTILSLVTLLMLAIAIPAAATTCSICLTHTTYNDDGTTQANYALCDPNPAGDINDCRVVGMKNNQECDSMSLVAACGEGLGGGFQMCPPWGCIYYIKDQKIPSMIRPILSDI